MSRNKVTTLLAAALLIATWATAVCGSDNLTVVTRGESTESYEAAEVLALRNAVRRAAGTRLLARTEVSNFALRTDTVSVRADGYVRSHEVLNRSLNKDGMHTVTVRAIVRQGRLQNDLIALQTLIEVNGHPAFSVDVRAASAEVRRWVGNELAARLKKAGFRVVNPDASPAGKAGILYTVRADVTHRTEDRIVYGARMEYTSLQMNVAVTRRETGELVTSDKAAVTRGSSVTNGVGDAAQFAVAEVFPRIRDRILAHWGREIDTGWSMSVRMVDVPYEDVSEFSKKIRKLPAVKDAQILKSSRDGTTQISVKGVLTGEDMGDHILEWSSRAYAVAIDGPRAVTVTRIPATAMADRTESPAPQRSRSDGAVKGSPVQPRQGSADVRDVRPARTAPATAPETPGPLAPQAEAASVEPKPVTSDTEDTRARPTPSAQPDKGGEEAVEPLDDAPIPTLPDLPVLEAVELASEVRVATATAPSPPDSPEKLDVLVARYGRQYGLPVTFGAGCSLLGFALSALISRKS